MAGPDDAILTASPDPAVPTGLRKQSTLRRAGIIRPLAEAQIADFGISQRTPRQAFQRVPKHLFCKCQLSRDLKRHFEQDQRNIAG